MKNGLLILLMLLCAIALSAQEKLPKIQREFRGMWIATVANLDFPSSPNLTADQQKAELVRLMNLAQDLKFNAVIFQVSSVRDAMYESEIDPWSEFLTGKMGKKGEFDPLKFAIDEAHSRGIVLHAWFNPYRAWHPSIKGEVAENHITKRRPDLVRTYNKIQLLDPGEKEVRDYIVSVVSDVVKRYDVDGVQFDDYFYPYPDADKNAFPDDKSWEDYKKNGGKLSRDDWRRQNVNELIERVSVEIKKIKPTVMFGVSPFGVWKPDETQGIKGLSAYDVLYADSRKWLQEGWVDYLAPQLYWSTMSNEGPSFTVLLKWWKNANIKKRHLWAGIATYKVGEKADYSAKEILDEIEISRALFEDSAGLIHFRALSLAGNKDKISELIRDKAYSRNAIIPASPWIDSVKPAAPQIEVATDAAKNIRVSWKNSGNKEILRWIFYWKDASGWKTTVLPAGQINAEVPAQAGVQQFAVSGVDRLGNVSDPAFKAVN